MELNRNGNMIAINAESKKAGIGTAGRMSVAGCLLVQICVGIIYLWSVLKSSVIASLSMSTATAGMMASYMLMAFVTGALIGGILTDRKGHRFTCMLGVAVFAAGITSSALITAANSGLLVVTYAVLGGIGSGIAYSSCINCIQKWMPDRKGLASGLAIGAFGFSTVIFVPVMRAVMRVFTNADGAVNFTGVFGSLGIAFFVLGMAGCLMIRRPAVTTAAAAVKKTDDYTFAQAIRSSKFWCIFFIVFFINGAWNIVTPMIYDLGLGRGLTPETAALALSLTGIANTAGRILMATLSDRIGRTKTITILSLMTVAASLLLIRVTGAGYVVVICALAFAYGGPSSINAAFTTDCFGTKHCAGIYGVIMLALGASSLFFNMLVSTVLGGNIEISLVVGAASALIPIVLSGVMLKDHTGYFTLPFLAPQPSNYKAA
ncbi:MAG: MFS transporter [Oscillospiraceae bacterium]|nr:MFS transporter [Oscillospiraceae bacterium]